MRPSPGVCALTWSANIGARRHVRTIPCRRAYRTRARTWTFVVAAFSDTTAIIGTQAICIDAVRLCLARLDAVPFCASEILETLEVRQAWVAVGTGLVDILSRRLSCRDAIISLRRAWQIDTKVSWVLALA